MSWVALDLSDEDIWSRVIVRHLVNVTVEHDFFCTHVFGRVI